MKLPKNARSCINSSNNLGELRIFTRQVLNIRYEWVNNVTNIRLLKNFILQDLFEIINHTLINEVTHKSELEKLSQDTIIKLFELGVYTDDLKNRFLLLKNTKVVKSKPKSRKRKGVMWAPRKKETKKAVSLGLTAFAVIILIIPLGFFSLQSLKLLLF